MNQQRELFANARPQQRRNPGIRPGNGAPPRDSEAAARRERKAADYAATLLAEGILSPAQAADRARAAYGLVTQ